MAIEVKRSLTISVLIDDVFGELADITEQCAIDGILSDRAADDLLAEINRLNTDYQSELEREQREREA